MSKLSPVSDPTSTLRAFPSRFKGPALLVCRKCERKRKHSGHGTSLKKALKQLARQDPGRRRLHVIPVSCLKLCPKDGVTVCTQADFTLTPPSLTLIRTADDVAELFRQNAAPKPFTSGAL